MLFLRGERNRYHVAAFALFSENVQLRSDEVTQHERLGPNVVARVRHVADFAVDKFGNLWPLAEILQTLDEAF